MKCTSHTCVQAAFSMLHVCICFASDLRVKSMKIFHKFKAARNDSLVESWLCSLEVSGFYFTAKTKERFSRKVENLLETHTHTHRYRMNERKQMRCFYNSRQSGQCCLPAGPLYPMKYFPRRGDVLVWMWLWVAVFADWRCSEKTEPGNDPDTHTYTHVHIQYMHAHVAVCLHCWFLSFSCSLSPTHTHTHRGEVERVRDKQFLLGGPKSLETLPRNLGLRSNWGERRMFPVRAATAEEDDAFFAFPVTNSLNIKVQTFVINRQEAQNRF